MALVRGSTGQVVARYSYDAWGKCTVTNASGYTVGTKNPFRYRGYYHDAETGLYYLNSRYYNPEFGRFISPDVFVSTRQGLTGANMFAYCGNNPVNCADSSGALAYPIYVYYKVHNAVLARICNDLRNATLELSWKNNHIINLDRRRFCDLYSLATNEC